MGRAVDGRSGEVEVSTGADGKIDVRVAGEDPTSALPRYDRDAGEPCVEGSLIVADIERQLPTITGLVQGELHIVERTRGDGNPPSTSTSYRPSSARPRGSSS